MWQILPPKFVAVDSPSFPMMNNYIYKTPTHSCPASKNVKYLKSAKSLPKMVELLICGRSLRFLWHLKILFVRHSFTARHGTNRDPKHDSRRCSCQLDDRHGKWIRKLCLKNTLFKKIHERKAIFHFAYWMLTAPTWSPKLLKISINWWFSWQALC